MSDLNDYGMMGVREEPAPETLPTSGITVAGELTSRTMREAITEPDFRNVKVAGYLEALAEVNSYIAERGAAAGPYDDVRALADLQTWVADRIRSATDPHAMNGNQLT